MFASVLTINSCNCCSSGEEDPDKEEEADPEEEVEVEEVEDEEAEDEEEEDEEEDEEEEDEEGEEEEEGEDEEEEEDEDTEREVLLPTDHDHTFGCAGVTRPKLVWLRGCAGFSSSLFAVSGLEA